MRGFPVERLFSTGLNVRFHRCAGSILMTIAAFESDPRTAGTAIRIQDSDGSVAAGLIVKLLGLLFFLCVPLAGCAERQVYRPSKLPVEFQAKPVPDLRNIPLPQFSDQSVPSDVIMSGDVLQVTVATDLESRPNPVPVRVDDLGIIRVPYIGPVQVGGLRFAEAERAIAAAAVERDVFRHPTVTVIRSQQRTYQVTVVGAVNKPGVYNLPASNSNLLSALVAAEGLNTKAGPVVEIRRAESSESSAERPPLTADAGSADGSFDGVRPAGWSDSSPLRVRQINLTSPDGGSPREYRLADGDVVNVTEREALPFFVDGLVAKPGAYPMPPDQPIRILDAVALAGGKSNPLADKVWIVRHVPGREEPVLIKVSLRRAKEDSQENLFVAAGDVISIEETPGTFIYNLLKGFVHIGGSVPLN
ncbi:polysaccharide biosynthesis/export family protein [Thermopirellula anaerolimosa]